MAGKKLSWWQRLNFRNQLLIIQTLLAAILTAIFTWAAISYERHNHLEKLTNEGEMLLSILKNQLQIPFYADNREEMARVISDIFRYPGIHSIQLMDSSGSTVAEIIDGSSHMKTGQKTISLYAEILPGERSQTPDQLLLDGGSSRTETIGKIRMNLQTFSVSNSMEHFIKMATGFGILFWLFISALGFLILKQMTNALGKMLLAVESIASGKLDTRISIATNSDSIRAANAINSMAETLQLRESENRRLNQEKLTSLRMEFDKEKMQFMAKLIQTNRMTSLGLLVSSMAHEINNPNGAVRLAGEYLDHVWGDLKQILEGIAETEGDFYVAGMPFSRAKEEIENTIGNISRSSARIEKVVLNLRSYSLGNRGEILKDIDINRVVNGALAIVQAHSSKSDISIVTRFDPDIPRINGNPFQLEQVFINLLMNAIQALPPKGSRRVQVTTGFIRPDMELFVEVRDEGHGIEPEFIPHLCEPFFSTRINSGGSGLGLYISNFLVSEHKGRMEFDSKPGTGCTVTVYLPASC